MTALKEFNFEEAAKPGGFGDALIEHLVENEFEFDTAVKICEEALRVWNQCQERKIVGAYHVSIMMETVIAAISALTLELSEED